MEKLLIIGAKGCAKELTEAVLQINPKTSITYFDDVSVDLPEKLFGKYAILRSDDQVRSYFDSEDKAFALGVGTPVLRCKLFEKFVALGGRPSTIMSPGATVGQTDNLIGEGCCVLTNAVIESSNTIGRGALVHVGALISHDVTIGEFCEISPRASLLGAATVGRLCSIGTGSVILPKITIGNGVVVGAGAVVTKDLTDNTIVAGVPARPLVK
jgi:sugar O-acyltransferase (sialic acid O-acetyltransferase NeuD family)